MVVIEYRIDPDRVREFRHVMREMRRIRRRDGAFRWGLYGAPANPGRFTEIFWWNRGANTFASILGLPRLTERSKKVLSFHLDEGPPPTSHLISEGLR